MWTLCVLPLLAHFTGTQGLQILLVNNKGVGLVNISTGNQVTMMSESELKEVDYHYARGEVYGLTKRQILRCPLSSTSSYQYQPVVYSEDEYNFMSMAVDWVHDTLYWTSGAVFMIHKAGIDGKDQHIIFRGYYIENFHKKLLVDPNAKLLIWSTTNQIYSTDLNGNNLHEIRFPEVLGSMRSRVKNIALDVTQQRIYFLAGFQDDDVWIFMSGKYDGTEFRRHDPVSRFTYAIAAMGDDVFWVGKESAGPPDWHRYQALTLFKASTIVPGASQKLVELHADGAWNMKLFDAKVQVVHTNVAASENLAHSQG